MRHILAAIFVFGCMAGAAFAADRPSNLLVVMTDDQGIWSLGCYGGTDARTPVLDRLAAEGVRMTNAFATIPVCSPSRATFWTGRIPSQHGIHDWIKHENMGPRARYCLDPDEVQLSEILARNGYTCGLSGKWHLGDSLHPHAGYTFWFAMPEGSSRYNDADMIRDGRVVQTRGYLTDRIADAAIEFLDANRERPFFLNVEFNAPHSPWDGHPEDLLAQYRGCAFDSIPRVPTHPWSAFNFDTFDRPRTTTQYFASVTGVDRAVGRILEHLDRLGLAESTLVVFTTDQGFNVGHHGLWGKGNASNPRNMYDTSMRIPMLLRQKGRIAPGKTVEAPVSSYDFLPTLLEWLNLPPSPGRNLPGKSFAALLRGEKTEWTDTVYGEYGQARMIRTPRAKYVHRANGGPQELYDLAADPGENTNLADDPAHQQQKKELRTRLFAWFGKYAEAGADPIGQEYLRPADK